MQHHTALVLICLLAAGCPIREVQKDATPGGADAQHDGLTTDGLTLDGLTPDGHGGPGCVHPKVVKQCASGWCKIPAGCYVMGSPKGEPCRKDNEDRHRVTLTRGFEIQQTEVTQGQFQALMLYNPSYFGPSGKGPSCGSSCPVETVDWSEAAAYCNALSVKQGLTPCYHCTGKDAAVTCQEASAYSGALIFTCPGYRLPTEAEFEYAYRAGTQTPYYSGTNDPTQCNKCGAPEPNLDKIAWYCPNAKSPQPAGTKQPNAWGLHDMAGSMSEHCHDRYAESLGTAAVTDPWGTTAGSKRALRGGSWYPSADYLRAAARDDYAVTSRWIDIGFRCVRTTGP